MPLQPGTTLGPYAVTAKIGEGGMGEVYRARDTKLDRDVALKVLPEAFTKDPDRLARFEREAKVLASLNHPNIAAIYGLEEADDIRALVLELVEGPTLADRIKRGPIPLDEALPIAKQIAEALEAAHEAGVIHRDLKPANIKVREDGTVKVLDFGLAKALDPNPEGDPSQSPTLTAAATQMGVIMGTAAYMSPEQARGKPVDRRTDIWAFGAVVFEMLTGERAFVGDDVSLTLAKVLEREPSLESLPDKTPPKLRNVLQRCLEKEPRQRVQAIGDVRLAMAGALETAVSQPSAAVDARNLQVWQRPIPAAIVALVIAAIMGFAVWGLMPAPTPRPVARVLLTPPPSMPLDITFGGRVALTPDGTRVVYRGLLDGQPHLFVRLLTELDATPLTGVGSNPFDPFISPDGAWVGFVEPGGLQRVSILGGPPVPIVDALEVRGASWGPDDTIIFGTNAGDRGLLRVSMRGGEPEVLTTPDAERGELSHRRPEILPGGEAVLFTMNVGRAVDNSVAVLSLESGEYEVLVSGGSHPRYVPTGHIVYSVGGTLRAVGFDLDSLTVTTDPVSIVDNVLTGPDRVATFAVAQDGSLVYVRGSGGGRVGVVTLAWVDRDGREDSLAAEPDRYSSPRLSPNGTRLAMTVDDDAGGSDIYIYDIARNNFTQFTFTDGGECCPVWTPDGKRVVFLSTRDASGNLYLKNADGTGEVERLTKSDDNQMPHAWSADGDTLVLWNTNDLHTWSSDSAPTSTPLFETEFTENRPSISPDGRWIAYESDEDGAFNVYVQPFPDVGDGKWKVSTQGGINPVWSPDGDELFYVSGDAMMVVPVTSDPTFQHGNPEVVFEGRYDFGGFGRVFDLLPEGTRFLVKKPADAQTDAPLDLVLVQNWFEELTRLVPTE